MSLELIGFERGIKERLRFMTRNGGGEINIECRNRDVTDKREKHSRKKDQWENFDDLDDMKP